MTSSPAVPAATAAAATAHRPRAAWHRPLLAVDAAACLALGAALLFAPGWFADGLGIATATPLRLVAAGFLAAAAANAWAARSEQRAATYLAVDLDVLFVGVAAVTLVADPGGAAGWAQAILAVGVVVTAAFGGLKLIGLRSAAAGARRP